jgi:hypothetical protein
VEVSPNEAIALVFNCLFFLFFALCLLIMSCLLFWCNICFFSWLLGYTIKGKSDICVMERRGGMLITYDHQASLH